MDDDDKGGVYEVIPILLVSLDSSECKGLNGGDECVQCPFLDGGTTMSTKDRLIGEPVDLFPKAGSEGIIVECADWHIGASNSRLSF